MNKVYFYVKKKKVPPISTYIHTCRILLNTEEWYCCRSVHVTAGPLADFYVHITLPTNFYGPSRVPHKI